MDKRGDPNSESPALAGPDYLSLVIEWEAPKEWDVVDEASAESFPASDAPGWGSSHAAPSEASASGDLTIPNFTERPRHGLAAHVRAIALAVVGLGSLIVLAARWRRAHA